jgi:Holliday junction resolvase
MIVMFEIPGEPGKKGRPRFHSAGGFVKTYTDLETAKYENLVKLSYKQSSDYMFDKDIYIKAKITACFSIPQSISKKKRQQMLDGCILPCKTPDVDNIAKVILDSLNCVAYPDDKQIVVLTVRKKYSDKPCVKVELSNYEPMFIYPSVQRKETEIT